MILADFHTFAYIDLLLSFFLCNFIQKIISENCVIRAAKRAEQKKHVSKAHIVNERAKQTFESKVVHIFTHAAVIVTHTHSKFVTCYVQYKRDLT